MPPEAVLGSHIYSGSAGTRIYSATADSAQTKNNNRERRTVFHCVNKKALVVKPMAIIKNRTNGSTKFDRDLGRSPVIDKPSHKTGESKALKSKNVDSLRLTK